MAKFEVQARVLDLLGLQQIANCPTAISELFKNAWDAYAERVMLDVYPESDQAILWDDGIGMTEDELLHRWLVVGAAGKEDLKSSVEPPEGMVPRPIQGEKGIGRLAISTLGDTLLLICRSREPQNPDEPLVALLINWNIVLNEHLRLSDLEIPQQTFSNIEELDQGIVKAMAEDLCKAICSPEQTYAWEGVKDQKKREEALGLRRAILDQLEDFVIDMESLKHTNRAWKKQHGVIFCIRHLQNELCRHVLRPGRDEGDQGPNDEIVQLLSNFRNRFELFDDEASGQNVEFRADVRRWDPQSRRLVSLFEENAAFEPADLRLYDHHVDVEFDEFGRFSGSLDIYGKPTEFPPKESQPKLPSRCGPFRLLLWYYHDKSDSRLEASQWTLINNKLEHFGGVMVYRDGLRVLPYGRRQFDWLSIEERRSKGAGYYFFSYRRMFGYVEIGRHENPGLRDKTGREGIIINAAYRYFSNRIEEFLIFLARRYFKEGTSFHDEKERQNEESRRVEREQKKSANRRAALRKSAEKKLVFMEKKALEQLELVFDKGVERLDLLGSPGATEITDALFRFEDQVTKIKGKARLTVPSNLSIRRDNKLKKLKHDHVVAYEKFSTSCHEVRQRFYVKIHNFPEAESAANRRKTLEVAYAQARSRIGVVFKALTEEVQDQVTSLSANLATLRDQQYQRIDEVLMNATDAATIEEARSIEIEDLPQIIEALSEVADTSSEILGDHQERLAIYLAGYFGEAKDELVAAQTSEIEELREKVDLNLGLVQLGLAVEIIDHDLNMLYRGIRASLARLRNLARNAPRVGAQVDELRSGFQHLEQRYRLMSPIYRGSYRVKSEIDGKRILEYCKDFLGYQLRSVGVDLQADEAFLDFRIFEVEAVVLPVFVNVIDNAIYWLRDRDERHIRLNLHGNVITICDTGPGIHSTDLEEIFQPFISYKPGGRGLGLYIARANLERYAHEIWTTTETPLRSLPGACICIRFHEDVLLEE
jgi:signal transduction histidine kinase